MLSILPLNGCLFDIDFAAMNFLVPPIDLSNPFGHFKKGKGIMD